MKSHISGLAIGFILAISISATAQDDTSKHAMDVLDEALSKSQTSSRPQASSKDNVNAQFNRKIGKTAKDYYDSAGDWYRKKQYDKAIDDFSKAIELNPAYAIAYHGRGSAWDKIRQYAKAISDLTKSIELEPDAYAYHSRGVSWWKMGQLDKAIEDINKAIELSPGTASLYATLAICWNEKGITHKAKEYASKAKQLDPSVKVPEF